MHRDRDVDLEREPPVHAEALVQDLALDTLLDAMAGGDEFLRNAAHRALLETLTDPEEIRYRQRILADCLEQPEVVRAMYELAVEAAGAERGLYLGMASSSPSAILSRAVTLLARLVPVLRRLRRLADAHAAAFASEGFRRLFATLREELDDAYFAEVERFLRELRFRDGVLMTAELGKANAGARYVLRRARPRGWMRRLLPGGRPGLSFTIPDRDENGARALGDLQARGLNLVANAVAQSADHVLAFFAMLRAELAFYVACLNLHERLGQPACFPSPAPAGTPVFSVRGLYDAALALQSGKPVVGNDVEARGEGLVLVTGANRGGKSTFLRSVGLSRLMMQCGMFVPAESFAADVVEAIFTHYKREEDPTMERGKLDEELARMSEIADVIAPNCLLLCNESFASTNEREGSEIGRQVLRALVESGVEVFYVTHLYDLARALHRDGLEEALFLRAERLADGRRTFRVVPGEPLPTSHGQDLYRRIFGEEAVRAAASG